jgi:hypothetical protein
VTDTDSTDFKSAAKSISKKVNDSLNKEVVNRVANDYGLSKRGAKKQQQRLEKENEQALK